MVPRQETGNSGPAVSLAEVARARQAAELPLRFKGIFHPVPMRDTLSGSPSPYLVYVSATHMAEVEVDMRKGAVRVLRVVAAHDVGRVIYPQGLKGQIEGAVSMWFLRSRRNFTRARRRVSSNTAPRPRANPPK